MNNDRDAIDTLEEDQGGSTLTGLLAEPEDFFKPDLEPTYELYSRKISAEPNTLKIRLVGKHPLWGHLLWNAGKVMADYIDTTANFESKYTLELGAGGALPSIMAAARKAAKVVVSDYPDEDLIENIRHNVQLNLPNALDSQIMVMGHLWGKDIDKLLDSIRDSTAPNRKFDYVILSDLIFNHHSHEDLLKTCRECVDENQGQVLVSFTHHRPKKIEKDMNFFKLAKECNFDVTHLFSEHRGPMFENDEGPEDIRSTVHFYILKVSK